VAVAYRNDHPGAPPGHGACVRGLLMLSPFAIVAISALYLLTLFAIAYWADQRADRGRSVIANPVVYALSLSVYATSWTFYGSVGRAASDGVGFLPIYIGPTLVACLFWVVLRKMVRISKVNRINSIADFIGARYGKSGGLAALVTVIAVIGIVPYISLQLKAVAASFALLTRAPEAGAVTAAVAPLFADKAFWVAILLAAFAILFGTRHLDAAERHEGMVAAIAFESLVKLAAFLAVGFFVTFGLFNGFGDLFAKAAADARTAPLLVPFDRVRFSDWAWLVVLSMFAVVLLPRQFQVAVVENVDERHLRQASWLFPAYLFAINLFVLPIALGGLLAFHGTAVDADTFVLALPMAADAPLLALFVFMGGLSAATGMVIVETIALSTMVSNDLVMPALLRLRSLRLADRPDLTRLLLTIRRLAIVLILLLGYAYFRFAGEAYALVAIGLISFAAVAQFAPAILGGLYWKGGTRAGAFAGLVAGFAVWAYTLFLPSLARSGWLPRGFVEHGLFGLAWLKPYALFGLTGLDTITHAMMLSMLANAGAYLLVSAFGRPSGAEQAQAVAFVDAFSRDGEAARFWRGETTVADLRALLVRFLGAARADEALAGFAARRSVPLPALVADPQLVEHVERTLAGAIGAASARVMVASVVKDEAIGLDAVMDILDETSQAIATSKALEEKRRELEAATAELRAANERLQEIDRMKDDFVSTVSHELRTPLTSIRAMAEILADNPGTPEDKRQRFLGIILKETERLTRLINQMLDLAKIESGRAEWHTEALDLGELVREAEAAVDGLFREKGVRLEIEIPPVLPAVPADRDRLMQVVLNLLSNAVKFCPRERGEVCVRLADESGRVRLDVVDNGVGIAPEHHERIFEKFRQVGDTLTDRPQGTGLGLPISRQIVRHLGGELWVESDIGRGAIFSFTLPVATTAARERAKEEA
jgi:Na+/proline symporter/nitrogen-specific signal transduction histidine kinase